MLRITILVDKGSWKMIFVPSMAMEWKKQGHLVKVIHSCRNITTGDLVFIIGYTKKVSSNILMKNRNNLVVHESYLPHGRGWSPLSWQILKGARKIPVTLFEAVDKIDAGPVYLRTNIKLKGTELLEEIRKKTSREIRKLCQEFVRGYPRVVLCAHPQKGKPTYFPKRTRFSNQIDVNKSMREQFNILRIADPIQCPAFFKYRGECFRIQIFRMDNSTKKKVKTSPW